MMHTEDEARERWCPFFRAQVSVGGIDDEWALNREHNVDGTLHKECCCIASDCMAWRKGDQIGIGPNGEKRTRDMDGRTRWVDTGYCGLAGKGE